ncbi:MAG: ATP-dependent DNA helicase RecG [Clostridiales bacterium]|nr:ATP-dependent DNA helicase RecG [Clostridiales bacterium]
MASLYKMRISDLSGIGAKRAALFNKLGIYSVGDLLNFYPRSYEDWNSVTKIENLESGGVFCIRAVLGTQIVNSRTGGGRIISKGTVYDDTGTLQIIFFNNKYISSMLKSGKEYYFYGKVTADYNIGQMISPTFSLVSEGAVIRPAYKQTAGLPSKTTANAVRQALSLLPKEIKDPLPEQVRRTFGLCGLKQALNDIHFPADSNALDNARRRLVTEELVVLNLGMRSLREHSRGESGIKINKDFSTDFEKLLPFEFTRAQKRVVEECVADLTQKIAPMNRLVQGDVGSGKTAVAASVCYTVIKNGFQAAFMAPTEILARQHYHTFCKLFESADINVALLTGALKESEKKKIRAQLACGEIDLIIGTHALITDKTEFKNLGLAVTDEQHRFGVAQRAKLLGKGENPHLLVMSATPIPRTLGLIVFGDLDISIIDELPPFRKPVKTMLINELKHKRAYEFIKNEISKGRQAYIVCPLVEEGELDNVASAEEYAAELMLREFSNIPVGIVHGRMKPSEKEEVMNKFSAGEYSLLVATTVIEVGVDVPNATVMMIENAERFGLSQLHQLRGRVGRGGEQSYCILVSNKESPETKQRLEVMCSTNDGFKIADEDLRMRGPGDFFGERQHGLPQMSIADFADTKSLELSQKVADYIMFVYKNLCNDELRLLKNEVDRLFMHGGQNSLN